MFGSFEKILQRLFAGFIIKRTFVNRQNIGSEN